MESVLISGECWKSHHVNYWLWGFLQKQCGFSIADDAALIHAHRLYRAVTDNVNDPLESNPRICWAVAGYNDSLKGSVPRGGCGVYVLPCDGCGEEYDGELTATIRVSNAFGDLSDNMLRIRNGKHPWLFSVKKIRNVLGQLSENSPVMDCNQN